MKIVRSIRFRFLLWLAVLLAGVLTAFGVVAHRFRQKDALAKIDGELERRVAFISSALRGPPGGMETGFDGPGGPGGPGRRDLGGPPPEGNGGPPPKPPGEDRRGPRRSESSAPWLE